MFNFIHANISLHLYTGPNGELFTSVLYDLYLAPDGFCFDAFCTDDPIMDNPKLHGYNVDAKVMIKNILLISKCVNNNIINDLNYI